MRRSILSRGHADVPTKALAWGVTKVKASPVFAARARTADPVRIGVDGVGHVVVDHMGYPGDDVRGAAMSVATRI